VKGPPFPRTYLLLDIHGEYATALRTLRPCFGRTLLPENGFVRALLGDRHVRTLFLPDGKAGRQAVHWDSRQVLEAKIAITTGGKFAASIRIIDGR